MTDRDERRPWDRIGETYNRPPETPRDAIWERIASRIDVSGAAASTRDEAPAGIGAPGTGGAEVVDLDTARRSPSGGPGATLRHRRWVGWSVAAAALLALGIGIGRMSAPTTPMAIGPEAAPARHGNTGLELATRKHLVRTESLLTMVRADARDGQVDLAVARWAEDLLSQTRLLLDRPDGVDAELRDLLLDLELVLVQVVGVAEAGSYDERSRTEVELTLKSLDEGEVLPRIQATLPPTMSGA